MEILFIILKIIGILLAILLLLGVAVIAVPARYRVEVVSQDETKGKVAVHWLLHLIDVRICYVQKEISYKLRVFGIALSLDKEKKEKPKKEKNHSQTEEGPPALKENPDREVPNGDSEGGHPEKNQEAELSESENQETKLLRGENQEENLEKNSDRESLEEGHTREKTRKKKKQKNRNSSKKEKKGRGRDSWQEIKEQFADIKNLISEETNQNAFRHLLQEFRYLLGRYAPRKASGSLTFSMGDPARTGKVLGSLSMLPFWSRYKVIVMPEFDSETFFVKGQICVKGHVRLWHVLVSGIRLIKDKNIRKLITSVRK